MPGEQVGAGRLPERQSPMAQGELPAYLGGHRPGLQLKAAGGGVLVRRAEVLWAGWDAGRGEVAWREGGEALLGWRAELTLHCIKRTWCGTRHLQASLLPPPTLASLSAVMSRTWGSCACSIHDLSRQLAELVLELPYPTARAGGPEARKQEGSVQNRH